MEILRDIYNIISKSTFFYLDFTRWSSLHFYLLNSTFSFCCRFRNTDFNPMFEAPSKKIHKSSSRASPYRASMPVEDFPSTGDVNVSKLQELPHIGSLFGTTHFKQHDGRNEYRKPRQSMTDAYIKPSTVCNSRRRTLKYRELFQLFIISTPPSLLSS